MAGPWRCLLVSWLAVAGCGTVVSVEPSSSTTTTDLPSSTAPGTGGEGGAAGCGAWRWARKSPWVDTANLVAVDRATGDVLVSGDFTETVDTNNGPVETENGWNTYLVRLTASGEPIWARAFGGKWADQIFSVAVDPFGDIVISGQFSDEISFGGPPLTTVSQYSMFVAKLTAGGDHLWSRGFVSTASGSVAIDAAGDVVIAGSFLNTLDLGGGPLIATPPIPGPFSLPAPDIFVSKWSSKGEHLWSKRFGGPAADSVQRVAVRADGTIVIAGSRGGANLDFGGGPLPHNGPPGVYLAALDAQGHHLWSKGFNGPDGFNSPDSLFPIEAQALAVTAEGDIVLAGAFIGATDFGGGPLLAGGPLERNLFVTRFDAAGKALWTRQFAGPGGEQIIADGAWGDAGSFAFTGLFHGSLDFGGGPLLSASDEYDIFVAELDAAGNHAWSAAYGGPGLDRGNAVAFDASGGLLLAGTFTETLPLACGSLTSAGEQDGVLTRIQR